MKRKVFIIAEAGINHNGSVKIAKKMVEAAKDSGADAIKFQTFRTENLVRENLRKEAHLRDIKGKSVLEGLKRLEFLEEGYFQLKKCAKANDILIFVSVFDTESLAIINKVDFPVIKIPSGEIVNLELLEAVSRAGKPVILSTGMASLEEIKRAANLILRNLKICSKAGRGVVYRHPVFNKGLVLMHTFSSYPALPESLNLRLIETLKSTFGLPVGYSDHSIGNEACLAAAVLGAKVIEKHFTLDRDMPGPDQKASIEPHELKELVGSISKIELMLGNGVKNITDEEIKMRKLFRKSIVAKDNIPYGSVITRDLVSFKRPLDGIPMEKFKDITGLTLNADLDKDRPLLMQYLKKPVK